MKPLLTVAIPTFNNEQQLLWCLRSLALYTDYPMEIVVVDNGRNGIAKDMVESSDYKAMRVIEPEENLGWMRSINRVLEETETRFFCMMNDDVIFMPGDATFWRTLIDLTDWEQYGVVGPCSNFVAGPQSLMDMDSPLQFEASLVIGLCAVLETEVFKEIGGLDENLPGGDDLDLSIRLRNNRKMILINKTAYLHHHGQQTGKRVYGEYYDSSDMQEKTNNALIAKHGIEKWYTTFLAQWRHASRVAEQVAADDSEDTWKSKMLEPYRGNGAVGLNIGCGNETCDWEDLTIHGLGMAKKGDHGAGGRKFTGASPDVTADAMEIPFADGSVDFIVASHLLERLVDPIDALEKWHRVLRTGGKLFITMPDHTCSPTMILDYTHVHAYTAESVERLFERLDEWELVSVEGMKSWGTLRVVAEALPITDIQDVYESKERDFSREELTPI